MPLLHVCGRNFQRRPQQPDPFPHSPDTMRKKALCAQLHSTLLDTCGGMFQGRVSYGKAQWNGTVV